MKSLPQQTVTDLKCLGTPYEMGFVQGRQRRVRRPIRIAMCGELRESMII